MDDPLQAWVGMEAFLRSLPERLPATPAAILLISAHWETEGFAFTGGESPDLIYDYYGFPPHTYQLRYDAPGAPQIAREAAQLLTQAGLKAQVDPTRGFDHGVFIPLKVAFPDADVPVVEMSLDHSLDPALHIAAGRALASLSDENVLIIGSGMSFHNLRAYRQPNADVLSGYFDQWLAEALALEGDERARQLERWADAPGARFSHPREEHLVPAMVVAGASEFPGERVYSEDVLNTATSGFRFG